MLVDQDSPSPPSSDAYLVYVITSHDSLHQAILQLTSSSRPPLTLVVNKMFRLFCSHLVGGSFAHFLRLVRYAGMLGSGQGPLLSKCLEPSSPSVRQFGSGFHSNRPSTYSSLGSPTRYGDQTLVPRPFVSPATPRRSSRRANINWCQV